MSSKSLYQITDAKPEDWQGIVTLAKSLGLDMHDMQLPQFKVYKHEDHILGIGRIQNHSDCLELCTLGVAEGYRGRGIGKALVKSLADKSENPVYLVTDIPEYFHKLGFTNGGEHIKSLKEKREICIQQLECRQPVIMVKQSI